MMLRSLLVVASATIAVALSGVTLSAADPVPVDGRSHGSNTHRTIIIGATYQASGEPIPTFTFIAIDEGDYAVDANWVWTLSRLNDGGSQTVVMEFDNNVGPTLAN